MTRAFDVRSGGTNTLMLSRLRASFLAKTTSSDTGRPCKVVRVDLDRKTDDTPCGDCPGRVVEVWVDGVCELALDDDGDDELDHCPNPDCGAPLDVCRC